MIGEEVGLDRLGDAGVSVCVACVARLPRCSLRAGPVRATAGHGLTVMIIAQAFFNISVTLSLVPTKGIPLPFISAGGSSLAISLFASGVLLNISKHGQA